MHILALVMPTSDNSKALYSSIYGYCYCYLGGMLENAVQLLYVDNMLEMYISILLHRSHHGVSLEAQDLHTTSGGPPDIRRGGNVQTFVADYTSAILWWQRRHSSALVNTTSS